MKPTFLYKSTVPAVAAAVGAYFGDLDKIAKAGEKFASVFGGKPMYCTLNGTFAGLSWQRGTEPVNPHLWTKRTDHGLRKPKPGGGPEGAALRAQYLSLWPTGLPKPAHTAWLALVTAESVDWRYSPGIAMSKAKPQVVYFESTVPFSRNVVEINRTEYEQGTKND